MKFTTNDFIKKAKEIHGDKYNYSLVNYINAQSKVKIICLEHGEFEQRGSHHLNGRGCKQCAIVDRANKKRFTTNGFIKKAKEIHGDKYDYSLVNYINSQKEIKIICPEHGEFEQKPNNHLMGKGCSKCGRKDCSNKLIYNLDDFIKKAKEVHGNKYDYSLVNYINNHEKIKIICPKHEEFEQLPYNHIQGKGCSKCINISGTNIELKLIEYLKNLNVKHILNSREYISPKEIDIFLPDYNLGIELCGNYWHSELFKNKYYHYEKFELAKKNNIKLLTFFEDEILYKFDIVKSIINNNININKKLYARKCHIKEISTKDARDFINKNHIDGYVSSKYKIGLFYNDKLVACITISKSRYTKNNYEISRFCNKINTTVVGGFSKLLKYFIKKYNTKDIISYVNLRFYNGNSYEKIGFKKVAKTPINYYYINTSNVLKRYSRVFFQKHKLKNKLKKFNSNLTEVENLKLNNYYRIWDCGNLKYIYNE
ncbi:MAG: hypothetical protein ACOCVF_02135 [bacterium]